MEESNQTRVCVRLMGKVYLLNTVKLIGRVAKRRLIGDRRLRTRLSLSNLEAACLDPNSRALDSRLQSSACLVPGESILTAG